MDSIAIYIGTLPENPVLREEADQFKLALIRGISAEQPDAKITLLSEESVASLFPDDFPVHYQILGQPPTSVFSLQRYVHHKLHEAVKECQPDLFISLTGVLPKKYTGKTLLLLPDQLSFIDQKKRKSALERFYAKNIPESLHKASGLLTLSEVSKAYFQSFHHVQEAKIQTLHPVLNKAFQPMEWEEREVIKEKYAEGKEFLLYPGGLEKKEDLLFLLKAFTVLKKKMNSGMVLVLTGDREKAFKKLPELIRTYHFGKDVKQTGVLSPQQKAKLLGAAYGCILLSPKSTFYSPVTDAIQCHTPAIVPEKSIHERVGGETVLSYNRDDYKDLGERLCELYRDEELRSRLIRQTEISTTQTSAEGELSLLSDIIRKISKE